MLAILSEIDCLSTLQAKGVYPDEFYTDIERFKNNTVFFRDATIIVIFAGNCQFNKKHTIELVKSLLKRAETKRDLGINHVYVVSDITIAGLRSYYKYEGNINEVNIMHGWDCKVTGVDIWSKLQNEPKEAKVFQSPHYSGVVDDAIERYKSRYSKEDEYIKLIKVPNLNAMLHTS